jgi:hypothetical protein
MIAGRQPTFQHTHPPAETRRPSSVPACRGLTAAGSRISADCRSGRHDFFRSFTAVPYARTSVAACENSVASYRIPMTASAPESVACRTISP